MNTYSKTVQQALENHKNGNYDTAKLLYVEALEKNPYDAQALQLLGTLLFSEGDYQSAIQLLKNSIEIDPNIYEAHNNLGQVYQQKKEYSLAIEHYQKAIQLKPEVALAHNNIATVYRQQLEYKSALKHYNLAIKYEPLYPDAYTNLANLHIEMKSYKDAEKAYLMAIKLNSQNVYNYVELAKVFQIANRIGEMIELFEKSIQLDDTQSKIYISLAIYAWIVADDNSCLRYLKLVTDTNYDMNRLEDRFILAYKVFLTKLLEFKKLNKNLYTEEEVLPILYVIGDSHCLSYSNLKVNINGQEYRIISKIIMGCKAWHLANEEDNVYKYQLKNILTDLKSNSEVLFIFGEIDCRLDEGIIQHYKKSFCDLERSISNMINIYTNNLKEICKKKNLLYKFSLIPAPVFDISTDEEEKKILKNIIELFNKEMKRVLYAEEIFDTFTATATKDMESNLKYHIDKWHLSPKVIYQI